PPPAPPVPPIGIGSPPVPPPPAVPVAPVSPGVPAVPVAPASPASAPEAPPPPVAAPAPAAPVARPPAPPGPVPPVAPPSPLVAPPVPPVPPSSFPAPSPALSTRQAQISSSASDHARGNCRGLAAQSPLAIRSRRSRDDPVKQSQFPPGPPRITRSAGEMQGNRPLPRSHGHSSGSHFGKATVAMSQGKSSPPCGAMYADA